MMRPVERPRADDQPILTVADLGKEFPIKRTLDRSGASIKAVDGVSFELAPGRTLGLVGESGCGKSTLGRMLIGHLRPTRGDIQFQGTSLVGLRRREWKSVRRQMQMVFQDPFASLNPSMTVGQIVGEPLRVHGMYDGESPRRIERTLELVGLPGQAINRYPHQFSGGQRQRIGIARAIILDPQVLILDEPVSALDVSVQAQIINLLQDLQAELGLSYVFIAHDISVVKHISDEIAVMYLGKIVESGARDHVFETPRHPYTAALMASVPASDPQERGERRAVRLHGEMPSPVDPPSGCRFRTRCWKAEAICADQAPLLERAGDRGSHVACHFPLVVGERERTGADNGAAQQ